MEQLTLMNAEPDINAQLMPINKLFVKLVTTNEILEWQAVSYAHQVLSALQLEQLLLQLHPALLVTNAIFQEWLTLLHALLVHIRKTQANKLAFNARQDTTVLNQRPQMMENNVKPVFIALKGLKINQTPVQEDTTAPPKQVIKLLAMQASIAQRKC